MLGFKCSIRVSLALPLISFTGVAPLFIGSSSFAEICFLHLSQIIVKTDSVEFPVNFIHLRSVFLIVAYRIDHVYAVYGIGNQKKGRENHQKTVIFLKLRFGSFGKIGKNNAYTAEDERKEDGTEQKRD